MVEVKAVRAGHATRLSITTLLVQLAVAILPCYRDKVMAVNVGLGYG